MEEDVITDIVYNRGKGTIKNRFFSSNLIKGDSGREYSSNGQLIVRTGLSTILKIASPDDNGEFVLKVYTEQNKEASFFDELYTLQMLGRENGGNGLPGVVRIHDSIEKENALILEYFGERNLEEKISALGLGRLGRIELSQAVDVSLRLSETLAKMHDIKICHRDFKPENVLVKETGGSTIGEMKVCDFGLSLRNDFSKTHALTKFGFFVGTVKYTAPEIFSEMERGSYPADVWALGVSIYDMVHLDGLFHRMHPREMRSFIEKDEIPRIEDSYGLGKLAYEMLSPCPESRPTMNEVNRELEAISRRLPEFYVLPT